ncbi:uroporphyrinogen-III C-methyltransferase [Nocardioides massiliensis]|uniref:Uroporphyrin-III C-methyltransferase/precorrin-2 dehydrogenase/sirohydrochlorin ferrochelatase n=1 Tax=Nocardioides massiliensis TaxID=1325935 RepID=A0ABT9NRN0_9ACTN|nr:uroporphyrinogen-III C-methyltransferase [Nocardioides massiliensis]MDP9823063.1 uroporphyrin-III C-methyltransferase/precorrin-2 dehydrogenase/sirohydrochlorin ferrochelatase [Nocardioides massiliensis]
METREGVGTRRRTDDEPAIYPVGLRLGGRRVVVVGGGHVAQRRVPTLLTAGALVTVVSPEVTPALEGLAGGGEITWTPRGFEAGDLDDAWYVIAATDDAEVNRAVSAAAEERRVFCVRSDDGLAASAWTPATGRYAGMTVAVLGNREPRRSAAIRDQLLGALRDGLVDVRAEPRAACVTLVGGGPGDPELVTLAARRAVAEADVVVADRLAPRELLSELAPDVELVDVTKLPRGRSALQEEINRVLVERALAGKRVVRLKGGDNFVFGRGFEEIEACAAAGVPVEVIPGLSSAIAVPGRAGIPLTHRGMTHEFTVVSGHLPPGHPDSLVAWEALARTRGTLVLLMAVQNAGTIAEALVEHGRAGTTPVAVISDGTMAVEREVITTLDGLGAAIEAEQVKPPAIIVIGDVVGLARPGGTG